jgi:signal transduction histidine kinase
MTKMSLTLPPVRTDHEQLRQALMNLLLNGIQASQPGQIVQIGFEQAASEVCFMVRDRSLAALVKIHSRVFDT